MALTTHPHLASRLKKECSYTSTIPLSLHRLFQGELTLYLQLQFKFLPHRKQSPALQHSVYSEVCLLRPYQNNDTHCFGNAEIMNDKQDGACSQHQALYHDNTRLLIARTITTGTIRTFNISFTSYGFHRGPFDSATLTRTATGGTLCGQRTFLGGEGLIKLGAV